MALLESALFTAAREAEPRVMAAAGAAFQYLLQVAQGSSAGPSPQVSQVTGRAAMIANRSCQLVVVRMFSTTAPGCVDWLTLLSLTLSRTLLLMKTSLDGATPCNKQ